MSNLNISEIEDRVIRLNTYREHGFTKEAFNDEEWWIRLEAYEKLGFTKEAIDDKDWIIRGEAKNYFENKNKQK